MPTFERIHSGLEGFDRIVDSIRMGDNVVWQLGSLDEYRYFVRPYVKQAIADRRNVIYIRFAAHPPLLKEREGLKVFRLDPEVGFENFTVQVHKIIAAEGEDAFYVFDSLSELQSAWASDLMMGCFFQVTCPYLFEMNTVAYFGILRNRHSFDAVARIRDTTQLLLDVFSGGGVMYVQPLKVWNRYNSTMFMPHRLLDDGKDMRPLNDSVEAQRFYTILNERGVSPVDCSLDNWDRTFMEARRELESGIESPETRRRLISMLMGRDSKIAEMTEMHFATIDLLNVKERMVGSGAVGGKAAGVLLSRKIVAAKLPELQERIEPHDSFYVGADVFYSYLVGNGWWKLRLEQRTDEGFFTAAAELGRKIMTGRFAEGLRDQFRRMLDYFGQSPIIVRSSSLLEDSFGNAFAGKYESVFCVNAGLPERRLEAFENAVKRVYASAMNPSALAYRRQRHLDRNDEQMAILVQRVSGSNYDGFFMPCAAGVGYSHNSYVWHDDIDPADGLLRLVAGLGTRAVERVESDYPRLVSLSAPELMPVAGDDDRARFSQKSIDLLNLEKNELDSVPLADAVPHLPPWLCALLCEHDTVAEDYYRGRGMMRDVYFCNCGKIVSSAPFIADMKSILQTLERVYRYPVDIEFTVNFAENGAYAVNLLQCRPLQIRGGSTEVVIPDIPPERTFFALTGHTMGGGADLVLDYVVLVDPAQYYKIDFNGKYRTARTVGKLNQLLTADDGGARVMLLGPGRWGTSSPELGVPVNFAEISGIAAICEVSYQDAHVMPELSYGSHFFQDLVEVGMFYAAIFDGRKDCAYRPDFFAAEPDLLSELLGEAEAENSAVRVYRTGNLKLRLKSDVITRRTVCGIFDA